MPRTAGSAGSAPAPLWTRPFASAFATYFLINLGLNLSNVLIPPFVKDVGGSPLMIGLVAGSFTVGSIVFKLLSAPAIDTFDRRRILLAAVLVIAVSFTGYAVAAAAAVVLAFRILQGAGQAFTSTTCIALAADTLPRRRLAAGLGIFALASGSAQMIGAPLALRLQEDLGFRAVFLIAVGVMALAAGAVATIRRAPGARARSRRVLRIRASTVIARDAIVPAALQFCFLFAWSQVTSFVVVFGLEGGLGSDVGFFFTVYGAVLFVSSPLGGRLVDRFGYYVVIPMCACLVLSLMLISVAHDVPTLLAAAVVGAFGYGAAGPVTRAMAMALVPSDRRGAASSTLYLGSDLGQLIGPVVGGAIATTAGYAVMFRLAPLSMIAAVVILLVAHAGVTRRTRLLAAAEERAASEVAIATG